MSSTYYYAIGTIVTELDCEGNVVENCVFLNEDGEFMDRGLKEAVVHQCEADALDLAQSVYGRVIKIHSDFVDSLNIKIKE
jgi:hypothetical protein